MQREKLTPDRIRRFNCPPESKQAFLFDTTAPRLAVRATQAGAKSFVFEAKLNRRTIRITIGDVRAWILDDGRTEARRLQTLVDQGIDPRELAREKKEAKAAAVVAKEAALLEVDRRKRFTLRALCEAYCLHLKTNGKQKSYRDTKSLFKVHVTEQWPDYSALPANEVTSHQIAAIIRKVREAGKERTAGMLRNYLTAAYNAARRAPFDSSIPSSLIEFEIVVNPAEAVPTIPVNRGSRVLSVAELKSYMESIGDDAAGLALLVALLSGGQRIAQLLRAKVSDFDTDTNTLRLWDSKGKRTMAREHLIPLGSKASKIVRVLSRTKQDDALLFGVQSQTLGNRVSEISGITATPFDLRDIRRTCETMLAGMGITKETRAQLLSHGLGGIQDAHYDRHSYAKEKHAALVVWERRLDEIANGQSSKNIIQLKRKGHG